MCVRPPPVPRSSRVERSVKVAAAGAPRRAARSIDEGRARSMSSVSTASSSWSPTSMVSNQETVSGRWVEDSVARACSKCEKGFSLTNRRHHCRVCGDIFCHACSRTKMVLATNPGEIPRRQRVCDPCATHAHSSAILYDAEEASMSRDNSLFSTGLSATEMLSDGSMSEDMLRGSSGAGLRHSGGHRLSGGLAQDESSVLAMAVSVVALAAAFWFLKDEVSLSNPAIYILLAGFAKNVYDLKTRLSGGTRSAHVLPSAGLDADDVAEVFKGMDEAAAQPEAASTAGSSDPSSPAKDARFASVKIAPAQREELLQSAQKALDVVYELSTAATDGKEWTPETPSIEGLDIQIHSRDGKPARIFKCQAEIPLSPDELFDELHGKFESSSTWNVTSAENNIVARLDEYTDVVQVVSAPALGGMITSRDFVNTRVWRKQGGGYIFASVSAGKNVLKPLKGIVRGENGPTGFLILPHESSPFKSNLVWILNCDIKGYFPSSIIRKGSISEVSCFVRNLRRYLAGNAAPSAPMEPKTSDVQ